MRPTTSRCAHPGNTQEHEPLFEATPAALKKKKRQVRYSLSLKLCYGPHQPKLSGSLAAK